jgi:hypothetical protein
MRIVSAKIGEPVRVPGSHGDLWTAAWADDGLLYAASDDTQGFDRACASNLAVNRIEGDDPLALRGTTINSMDEYGFWGEVLDSDRAFWKANGIVSVDSALYLTVSRHSGYMDCDLPHQEAFDATIVRSLDHGETWSPAPALGASMFPGPSFATPFFVDHGRDQGDAVDEFVYAVSSDGAWNNGSSMRLGRVRRDRLGRLDAADWEFVQDFDHEGDGAPIWGARHDTARSIFRAAGRASMTGIHYVAPLGLYVLPQWHYPHLGELERGWGVTRWELYQAPAPWGPWELFHTCEWAPQAFYNPWIVSKFTSADGRRLWVFTAGDFRTGTAPDGGHYVLHVVPVELEVDPNGVLRTGPSDDALRERAMMFELKAYAEGPSRR